jgi:hypothetical protein
VAVYDMFPKKWWYVVAGPDTIADERMIKLGGFWTALQPRQPLLRNDPVMFGRFFVGLQRRSSIAMRPRIRAARVARCTVAREQPAIAAI